jgi:hypothetical protein
MYNLYYSPNGHFKQNIESIMLVHLSRSSSSVDLKIPLSIARMQLIVPCPGRHQQARGK